MTHSDLGRVETFREFAVYRTEPGFTGFDGCLTVLLVFRRDSVPQARQIDDIGSHAVLWA
jgi:hypothetical protein